MGTILITAKRGGAAARLARLSPGGSGGGQSLFEAEPAYQLDVQTTGFRTIPDVSIIGGTDVAIVDSYDQQAGNPGWSAEHGTSLSTPIWAGIIALVDQGRAEAGEAAFNSDNPEQIQDALYSLPATDFNSPAVLGGDNGTTGAGLSDPARYDEVTGLGSPISNLLVPEAGHNQAGIARDGGLGCLLQRSGDSDSPREAHVIETRGVDRQRLARD